MRRPILAIAAALALTCVTTSAAGNGVPPLLFPVVGPVTYTNDFGQARAGGPHQGNDLVGTKRAPVVAVEEGTVEFWTTSANAGCMLYLHGVSGTMYEYIHLNNDLTARNGCRTLHGNRLAQLGPPRHGGTALVGHDPHRNGQE